MDTATSMERFQAGNVTPDDETLERWQRTIDLVAGLFNVPAGLIMCVVGDDISVLVASQGKDNPFEGGETLPLLNSGLYCEWVIRTSDMLEVPDARADPEWDSNPELEFGLTNYLGLPIRQPDGTPFGTICVMDRQIRKHSDEHVLVLGELRDMLEQHLELLHTVHELRSRNAELTVRRREIGELRDLVPICSYCKNVRDEKGYWERVEGYIADHSAAQLTHGICNSCYSQHFPDGPAVAGQDS